MQQQAEHWSALHKNFLFLPDVSHLYNSSVYSLVVQRLRNKKTIMAKRRRVTADELLSILRNILDDVSDCEDRGSEFDGLHAPDLVSASSSND